MVKRVHSMHAFGNGGEKKEEAPAASSRPASVYYDAQDGTKAARPESTYYDAVDGSPTMRRKKSASTFVEAHERKRRKSKAALKRQKSASAFVDRAGKEAIAASSAVAAEATATTTKRVTIDDSAAAQKLGRIRGASGRRAPRRSSLPQTLPHMRGSKRKVATRARSSSSQRAAGDGDRSGGGGGGRGDRLVGGRTASTSSTTSITGARAAPVGALWPLKGMHSYASFRLARRHRGSSHAISFHFAAAHATAERFAAAVLAQGARTVAKDAEKARREQANCRSQHKTGHALAMKQLMSNARRIRLRTRARKGFKGFPSSLVMRSLIAALQPVPF